MTLRGGPRKRLSPHTAVHWIPMLILGVGGVASAATLDFRQCVDLALRQNPDARIARAQIEEARAGLRQAQRQRFPKLTASLTGMRTNDALNAFGLKLSQRRATFNDFGAGQFTGPSALGVAPTNLNYPGAVNNFNTRLELQIPVYNGGSIGGYVDQARAYVRAARRGDEAARQNVVFQVLEAYEGVHAARRYVKVAREAERAAKGYVKTTRNLLAQGVVVKSDLLSAEVNLQNARVSLEQAQDGAAAALDQLHLAIGLDLSRPLDVGPDVSPRPLSGTLQTLEQAALAHNPGIHALQAKIAAARAGVAIAAAANKPHFNLMARQDWNDQTPGLAAPSYTVAAVASMQLFDGGVTRAAEDRAEAVRIVAQTELAKAQAGVRFQVDDAWRKAREARTEVEARATAVAQAEEAQRLIARRYANGVTTMVEVETGEAQLDGARAALVAARYREAVSEAALDLAVGRLSAASF
ncbi:MAG: TolC family protein [Betaproteobacteria bacterium]|nr:TolC family protein [Betaproteobacteria bacterium]